MKMRNFLIAAAAALSLASLSAPAFAAGEVLCSPEQVVGAQARRITVTSSTATTQPVYNLNGQGCAYIAQADIGFFLAQGFSPGTSIQPLILTTGVATSTTDYVIGSIPAGAYIREFVVQNSTANAVTGGIDVGTTANGVDVISAQACAASCLNITTDALLLKRVFSTTAATPIHAAAHTAWNNANVTITIIFGYF